MPAPVRSTPGQLGIRRQPGLLEQLALALVRARLVAAGGERRLRRRDPLDRLDALSAPFTWAGSSAGPAIRK